MVKTTDKQPADIGGTIPFERKNLIRAWMLHTAIYAYFQTTILPLQQELANPDTSKQKKSSILKRIKRELIFPATLSIWQYWPQKSGYSFEIKQAKTGIEKHCQAMSLEFLTRILKTNILRAKEEWMEHCKTHNLYTVQAVKEFAEYYLYLRCYDEDIRRYTDYAGNIHACDLAQVRNIAVSAYIEQWLSSDLSYTETANHFAEHPYELRFHEIKSTDTRNTAIIARQFRSIINKKYKKYCALGQAQNDLNDAIIRCASGAGTEADRLRLKTLQLENIAVHERNRATNHNTRYPPLTMAWCNIWYNQGFSVLDYFLFQKRNLTRRKEKTREPRKDHNALLSAWESHYRYLEKLNGSYDKNAKNNSVFRQYVCECVILRRYEIDNCHHLLFQAAYFLLRHNRTRTKPRFHAIAMAYWSHYPEVLMRPHFITTPVNGETDVMHHPLKLGMVYHTWDRDNAILMIKQLSYIRLAVSDLTTALHSAFPLHVMPGWMDKEGGNFRAAAQFFHEEYNFLQNWLDNKPAVFNIAPGSNEEDTFFHHYDLLLADFQRQNATYRQAVSYLKP